MLLLRASANLEAVAMNEYSAFPKATALLKPHYQCNIQDTRWGSLTSLQRYSRGILQPTGPKISEKKNKTEVWLKVIFKQSRSNYTRIFILRENYIGSLGRIPIYIHSRTFFKLCTNWHLSPERFPSQNSVWPQFFVLWYWTIQWERERNMPLPILNVHLKKKVEWKWID